MPIDIDGLATVAPTGTEFTFLYQHPDAFCAKIVTGGVYNKGGSKQILIYEGMTPIPAESSGYYTIVSSGVE